MFFTAVVGLVALTVRLSVRQLFLSGIAAPISLAASSLASTWQGVGLETTLLDFVLRFIPAALVLGYFNLAGRAHFAGLATLWMWVWLELTFVLKYSEQPTMSDFIFDSTVFYLMLPAVSGLLMTLLASLASILNEASWLNRSHSREH